jgi:hypothetical protein
MKYKIGNTVCIKSISDIGRIIDSKGCVGGLPFKVAMNNYCSSRMTIDQIDDINGYYRMKEDPWHFYNDEMIERLVEDLLDNEMEEHQKIVDEIMTIQGIEPIEAETEEVWHCPEGYIFKDENGNVINATKIVLEKKKKEYPKTYEECCEVLGYDDRETYCVCHTGANERLFESMYRLKVCRDAYWKIAGDEMDLGKSWEPDWADTEIKYCIANSSVGIKKSNTFDFTRILAFPTAEMRDAFKENFDPDIEICKEFL